MGQWTLVTGQVADNGTASSATDTVVLPLNPTAGNTVLVGFIANNGGTTPVLVSVKDANNNSYTVAPHSPSTYDSGAGNAYCAYLLSAPANADKTITVTMDAVNVVIATWVAEFHLASGSASFDNDAIGSGTGTAVGAPTIPVAQSDDLLFGVVAYASSILTADSPFTGVSGIRFGCYSEYDLSANAGTPIAFTGDSGAAAWRSAGMSIKGPPSGPSPGSDSLSVGESDVVKPISVTVSIQESG